MALRAVFMGTPDFGVPTLRALAADPGIHVVAAVTAPDRPCGRGRSVRAPAAKLAAGAIGVPVMQPAAVNAPAFLDALRGYAPEVVVVAAFGQILGPALLALPTLGCLNVHASLLPRYRGAAPIQWALAEGDTETGVTIQKMVQAVDAGDVLVQHATPVGPDETAEELFVRLAAMGGPAAVESVHLLAAAKGRAGAPQDESRATYAPRLTREDGRLDWQWPAEKIHNRVRGFNPWPGTTTTAGGENLKVLATERSDRPAPKDKPPGTVLAAGARGWWVAAGRGTTLWIRRVQCANRKIMDAQAFTCGYHFGAGDRLTTGAPCA